MKRCIAGLFVFLLGLVIVAPVGAARTQPVSIAQKAITVTLKKGARVTVINTTGRRLRKVRVRLSHLRLKSPKSETELSNRKVFGEPKPMAIAAGGERRIRLRASIPVKSRRYRGHVSVFVVGRSTVARIPFVFDARPEAKTVSKQIIKPAARKLAKTVHEDDTTISVPLDTREKQPAIERKTVGILVTEDGDTASVEAAQTDAGASTAEVEVTGVDKTEVYSGTVDFAPGEDGGDVELTVTRSDPFYVAVLFLFLGLLLALWLKRWTGAARPLLGLEDRLAAAQVRFKEAQDGELSSYNVSVAFAAEADHVRAFLEEMAEQSFNEVNATDTATATKRIEVLERAVDQVAGAWAVLDGLQAALERVEGLEPIAGATNPPGFTVAARRLLDGNGPTSLAGLDKVIKDAEALTELAGRWPALHSEAAAAAQRVPDGTEAQRKLFAAWRLLSDADGPDVITERELMKRFTDALALAAETDAVRFHSREARATLDVLLVGRRSSPDVYDAVEIFPTLISGTARALPADPVLRRAAIQHVTRTGDLLVIAFAAAVAIWSGLEALYVGEAFGGPYDYIKAVAWALITASVADALAKAIQGGLSPLFRRDPPATAKSD